MNLKATFKRFNLFTQGQRLIVIISVCVALVSMMILYYTPSPLLLAPIIIVLNYGLFRRLLVTKKIRMIIAKSLRPFIWLSVSLFYFYSIYSINSTPAYIFIICLSGCSAVYGLLSYIEIQQETNLMLNNSLTLVFILITTSLSSLLVSYWNWPVPLVMVGLWLVNFLIGLWWLLDFTNKPQLLAALWGFVVVELAWLASRWTVLYQIPNLPLIVSQFSAIVTSLAYGWGGIYFHYKHRSLKKAIVFEYLGVTIVVFAALILLNRWTSLG